MSLSQFACLAYAVSLAFEGLSMSLPDVKLDNYICIKEHMSITQYYHEFCIITVQVMRKHTEIGIRCMYMCLMLASDIHCMIGRDL